jgi:hypothetical protein
MLNEALPFRVVRTKSHDEFQRRADECRRLAAAARNARDRAFWLGLVERWRALENLRQPVPTLLPPPLAGEGKVRAARNAKAVRTGHRR